MTPDELVERVATAIARAYVSDVSGGHLCLEDSEYHWSDWRVEARAAIAVVLEEAAKVADAMSDKWDTQWREDLKCDSHLEGQSDGAHDVAAAIRAMVPKGGV